MKLVSSANKQFTSRELTILQKLYRSREFKNKLTLHSVNTITYTFIVYGSRNTISSAQRRLFREHLNGMSDFSDIVVNFTLFSSTVSQYIRGFSALQKLDRMLKGTTYQRVITVTCSDENSAYAQLFSFFSQLSTLKFGEEATFNFTPSLIFPYNSKTNMLTPMRFYQGKQIFVKNMINRCV